MFIDMESVKKTAKEELGIEQEAGEWDDHFRERVADATLKKYPDTPPYVIAAIRQSD